MDELTEYARGYDAASHGFDYERGASQEWMQGWADRRAGL
jgi:hypothetical protein